MSRADRSIIAAAETLGASPWRILFTIILPLAAPGILAGWVLVFASATTSYVTQSVIGGARHIYLPQFVYREVGILFQWPSAAAIAFILLLSTGAVMLGLAAVARHPRIAGHGVMDSASPMSATASLSMAWAVSRSSSWWRPSASASPCRSRPARR